MKLRIVACCLGLLALAAIATVSTMSATATSDDPSRPNIVFVLTDDLDSGLLQYMPTVQAMEKQGMTFTNYTVTDSLCCPSRASILTGEYVHNHGVIGNLDPDGGFGKFVSTGDETHTWATSVQDAGYDTMFTGKYLNNYGRRVYSIRPDGGKDWARPGWTDWGAIDKGGYNGYDYNLIQDDSVEHSSGQYATYAMQNWASDTIAESGSNPFALEIATYAPHHPYVPANEDAHYADDIDQPHGPSFDTPPTHAPPWLAKLTPMTADDIATQQSDYRLRIDDVQSVDRMIAALRQQLADAGELDNTYFVFSSDNGYHLGEHRLLAGKQTAFDTDINVPLVVTGPGIQPGSTNDDEVENIDLAPTFDDISGATIPATVDGESFLPLLHGQNVPWRTYALVEHTHQQHGGGDVAGSGSGAGADFRDGDHDGDDFRGADAPAASGHAVARTDAFDPDAQNARAGNPPSYQALRTNTFTYVRYDTGAHEFYNRAKDPYELHNVYRGLGAQRRAHLETVLNRMTTCVGAAQCSAAAR